MKKQNEPVLLEKQVIRMNLIIMKFVTEINEKQNINIIEFMSVVHHPLM